jgi:hypothetical protein
MLASRGNLVPILREIRADLDTALSLSKRLDDGHTSFLLEFVQGADARTCVADRSGKTLLGRSVAGCGAPR